MLLSFNQLQEKKKTTKIIINPKKEDVMEKSDGLKKNHGEDCDCLKCEQKRRADDVNDGPDIANEELKMTRKAYSKIHKDFRSDMKNPRTTKYVPGKGTVSMPVKFVEEGHKSCGEGQYYCHDDKKCKPIPEGYKEGKDGMLVKEAKYEAGASNYGKMSIRNKRAVGYGGNAAPPEERRKAHDERMKKHKGMKEEVEQIDELKLSAKDKEGLKRSVKAAVTNASRKVGLNRPEAMRFEPKEEVEGFKRFVECWKTHKKVGMKMKGGKLVNDCRPKNEEKSYYIDKEAEKRGREREARKAQNKAASKERAAQKRRSERNALRRQGKYGAVGGYYVTKHMEREGVETYIKNNNENIYGSQKEVSQKSNQSSKNETSILAEKDTALDIVKKGIIAKYGKGAIMRKGSNQPKKVRGAKSTVGTGKYLQKAKAKAQLKSDAKEMGYGNDTKGYIETRARYGSKENMKKGKGLGT